MKKINGKVRVALVGTGGISSAHAKGCLAHANKIECVALCDISEANLKARSDQLGGVKARFSDWREMLRDFGDRVFHVHGKDCALSAEGLYDCGNFQPPTFAKPPAFGGMCWRYTIPGHGLMDWVAGFRILKDLGYEGCVSVELEDANFNGTEAGEKQGFVLGCRYLQGC